MRVCCVLSWRPSWEPVSQPHSNCHLVPRPSCVNVQPMLGSLNFDHANHVSGACLGSYALNVTMYLDLRWCFGGSSQASSVAQGGRLCKLKGESLHCALLLD